MAGTVRALARRLRGIACEFAKFGVVGVAGVFIANAVYDLLNVRHGVGPVTSATVATVVAAVATYLGNRYWSFRRRQRKAVAREVLVFAVLNGIGLLIQDATVAFNSYLLHLGHDRLAAFVALNLGIALATLFRFWSYRRFVWSAPAAPGAGAGQPGDRILHGLPARRPSRPWSARSDPPWPARAREKQVAGFPNQPPRGANRASGARRATPSHRGRHCP